ncbi:hypothetical protein Tco_0558204 [Tanacetum coccineum]
MLAIFHDMIKESVEVFMDDFFVFGNSFDRCLNNLDKILQSCKDAHLVFNWEKCHFMVKDGIVLGHKVSSAGLEVDKAKIDIISKLPPPLISKDPSTSGEVGSSARAIKASASSRSRKSLIPERSGVGEEFEKISGHIGVGLPMADHEENRRSDLVCTIVEMREIEIWYFLMKLAASSLSKRSLVEFVSIIVAIGGP